MTVGSWGAQKRALDTLELEIQAVMKCSAWVINSHHILSTYTV